LAPDRFSVRALPGLPRIRAGDDLATLVLAAVEAGDSPLRDGDIVAFSQKIVSKAEGRTVDIATLVPGAEACRWADITGKDARLVELILSQSERVVRAAPNVLIVRHRLGFVMANAGVDFSNVGAGSKTVALLLPEDPDRSAAELRSQLEKGSGRRLGVIVIDSFGRAWRKGTIGTAIGVAGLPALVDLRGEPDLDGRRLEVTETALADHVAGGACLVMGEAGEGRPVAVVSGVRWQAVDSTAASLLRSPSEDLFL
jgi:coenzyme F420-0:L-glutamate ligase/coenzyme F420-1:gamma-L-glutamate ligase